MLAKSVRPEPWLFLIIAAFASGSSATSSAPVPAPPFERTIDRVLAEAPDLDAFEERLEAARARIGAVGGLPPLSLDLLAHDDTAERSITPEIEARQSLALGGRRGGQVRLARAELLGVEARRELARRDAVRQVAEVYARLYAIEVERQTLEAGRTVLLAIAAQVEASYASKGGPLSEAARAEVEIAHLDQRLIDLEADRATTASALEPLLRDGEAVRDWQVSSLPACAVDVDSVAARAERNSPEVGIARAELRAAEQQVRLARAEQSFDLSIGAGLAKPEGRSPEITAAVGLELPLWSRRPEATRVMEHEQKAALSTLEAERTRARASAGGELARWSWAEQQRALLGDRILPLDESTLDLARSAYSSGRGEFSAVLDAFRSWLDDRARLAVIESERFVIWSRIESLTAPLEPLSSPEDP